MSHARQVQVSSAHLALSVLHSMLLVTLFCLDVQLVSTRIQTTKEIAWSALSESTACSVHRLLVSPAIFAHDFYTKSYTIVYKLLKL